MSVPDSAPDESTRRARTKRRLYVLGQAAGWGSYLLLQLVLIRLFPDEERKASTVQLYAAIVGVCALGLALTHFARRWINRWGWKELGWLALLPRVLALSAAISVLWTLLGYLFTHLILQVPPNDKYPVPVLMGVSIFYGWTMLVGWFTFYFCYHLFDRINRAEIERLQLQASVKEAELRALKAQINPHFIFNALNTVRALIDEDPARARDSVTQLANLLRYSLQSGQQETVLLEEELGVINDYLTLEQVRHEERLRLRIDIAPETLRVPLPPMLLQTLVENAVKYGISPRPEGGEIAVVARLAEGNLQLEVTNPGELSGVAEAHRRAGSTGLGLRNSAERLNLLFGARASLTLGSPRPGLVVATVTVPLDEEVRRQIARLPRLSGAAPATVPVS